jgi:hypothetical protein
MAYSLIYSTEELSWPANAVRVDLRNLDSLLTSPSGYGSLSSTPRAKAKAVSSTDTMNVDGREVNNFILGMECSGFNVEEG